MEGVPAGKGSAPSPRDWQPIAACAAMIILILLDRYSYGHAGGLQVFGAHPFQAVAAAAMVLLLLAAGGIIAFRRFQLARPVLVTEAAAFVLLNLFYVLRDGAWRFFEGYEHRPTGLVLVLGGLGLRVLLLRLLIPPRSPR